MVTGGTGGHIYPALALADYIKEHSDSEILFVGNDDRMEHTLVPQHGYPIKTLHTSGLVGSPLKKGKAVVQSGLAYIKAQKILRDYQPDVVIGFGGYVSVPVLMAAQKLKIKTVVHEQNSIAGSSNKVVAKNADAVIVCYENAIKDFDNKNICLLGNPRASLAANAKTNQDYYAKFRFDNNNPTCLVVMGSLGSETINAIMKDVLKNIKMVNFLYVAGKRDYQRVKDDFKYDNVRVVDYINQLDIIDEMAFIICRAGATTAAEVCAGGVVSIMVPSPFVAHNHQYYNAKSLADKHAALMIEEKDLNEQSLCDKINTIVNDSQLCEEIKTNAKALGFPNACKDIFELIKKI